MLVQYVHSTGTSGDSQSTDWIDSMKCNMFTCVTSESGQITLALIAVPMLEENSSLNVVPVIA